MGGCFGSVRPVKVYRHDGSARHGHLLNVGKQGAVNKLAACSFGWWLMAGAGLFREKSTASWLLVAGLF
jgi:hypothetical protein